MIRIYGLRGIVGGQEAIKMSDDEDRVPAVSKQRIHFGSFEAVEKERLAEDPSSSTKEKKDDQEGEENGVSSAVSGWVCTSSKTTYNVLRIPYKSFYTPCIPIVYPLYTHCIP